MSYDHYHRHGLSKTPEYRVWQGMLQRCNNRKCTAWKYYGGRGIKVCDRWAGSFGRFLADVGRRPSDQHTIDRVDNNGHYAPGNCRWVVRLIQQRNTRWSKSVRFANESIPVGDLKTRFGLSRDTFSKRVKKGFTQRQAAGLDPITTIERLPGKSSKHEGVCWDKSRSAWLAFVKVNGRMKNLGRFLGENAAARVAAAARNVRDNSGRKPLSGRPRKGK